MISLDNDICSNSIHTCSAQDVLDCFQSESLRVDESTSPGRTIAALSKSNAFSNSGDEHENMKLPVVTWRTIVVSGQPPEGRYYHSATYVQGTLAYRQT